jgi:hypothetical protein
MGSPRVQPASQNAWRRVSRPVHAKGVDSENHPVDQSTPVSPHPPHMIPQPHPHKRELAGTPVWSCPVHAKTQEDPRGYVPRKRKCETGAIAKSRRRLVRGKIQRGQPCRARAGQRPPPPEHWASQWTAKPPSHHNAYPI